MTELTGPPRMPNSNRDEMNDVIAHLNEVLNEDEQAAKRVHQPYRLYIDDSGRMSEPKRIDDLHGERDGEYEQWADGEDRMPNHIASWSLMYDPARRLREVEAIRQVISDYRRADRACMGADAGSPEYATIRAGRDAFQSVLRAYAVATGWERPA